MEEYLTEQLCNTTIVENVLALVTHRQALLPLRAQQVVHAGQVLKSLKVALADIKASKEVGFLGLAMVLGNARQSSKSCPALFSRKGQLAMIEGVKAELEKEAKYFNDRFAVVKAAETFLEARAGLHDAVTFWNFDKVPWIKEETTPEEDLLGKKLVDFVQNFQSWRNPVSKGFDFLHGECSPDTFLAKLSCHNAHFEEYEITRQKVAVCLASVCLTSLLLRAHSEGELHQVNDYVRKTLKVEMKALPFNLQHKVGLPATTSTIINVDVSDASSVATGISQAITEPGSDASGKAKKLKRLEA